MVCSAQLLVLYGTLVLAQNSRGFASMAARSERLRSIDFEVFGHVQGVFFRKYTQKQAASLGLKGWCKNTSQGTVTGSLEGPSDNVTSMMDWLRTQGSPSSKIDKAEFKNDKEISQYTYKNFNIVKN